MKAKNSETNSLRNQPAMPKDKFLLLSNKSKKGYQAMVIFCLEQFWHTERLTWVAQN